MRKQATYSEKIFANHIPNKGLISRKYRRTLRGQQQKKQKIQLENEQKTEIFQQTLYTASK